jgi:hypothetical protein
VKETVFEHADGNNTFTVTAAERWSIGMIQRLAKQRPDEVKIIDTNPDGSLVAHLPLSWMKIKPKRKVVLSDEQIRQRSELLKSAREATARARADGK